MRDDWDETVDRLQSVGDVGATGGDTAAASDDVGPAGADAGDGPGLLVRWFGILGLAVVASMVGQAFVDPEGATTISSGLFVEVVVATELGYALAAVAVFHIEDVEGPLGHLRLPTPTQALLGAIAPGLVLGAVAVWITAAMVDGGAAVGPIVGPGAADNASAILLALLPLSVFAIAPAEELFFRGLAQRYFAETTSTRCAILAAAFLFALLHAPQYLLISFAPAVLLLGLIFMVGAAAGLVYERSGSLAAPIALHGTYNCVIVGVWWAELEYGVLPV